MRLKAIFPLILAAALLALALTPLTLAADPDLVPLGQSQSDARAAYRALFSHLGDNGRAHWAQQSFDHAGTTYPPGTLVAPDGLPGSGFDRFSVTGPVNARPALALDAVGTRVAVFRSTVTGTFGAVDWELADVRETLDSWLWGTLAYDILDEADLAAADLSQYALLVLPSVRWGNEQDVLDKLNPAARANLNAFVENGGFLYAQANGAVIAEAAGLVPSGTVDLANPLRLAPGAANNAGRMSILDPASPLAFSWLTDTLYLLTDPAYHAGPLNVVAEFTNLDGPNQPAILTGEVGRGRVILVDGHPTAATRRNQLPVLLDAILWALGRPAELFGDAVQAYNPALDPHLLPAYDPGAVVSVSLTFGNVWDAALSGVAITETVAAGFEVLPATVSPAASVIAQSNPTRTLVVWHLGDVPPGEINLSFQAQTGAEALAKGELTFATGASAFTLNGKAHTLSHPPFTLTSRMAARLQLDRDLEGDRQYFIPAEGLYLDVTVPIENKEETRAANVVITDVVLLIAPIVGLDDQETIEDLNSGETIWVRNEPYFYNEATGAPYLWPDGYTRTLTNTLTLTDDWDGAVAEFDVPYGTHFCGLSDGLSTQGTGNCVTIPLSYTQYITITPDFKLLLPVKVLTWTLGDWPGYHYEEPALRYGIHSSELFSRPVTFAGDPGIVPDQLVMRDTGGSVYTHLGGAPIFYRDHVSSGAVVYTPAAPVQPLISWQDIWSRTYTVPLRSTFYDLFSWASCGSCGPGTGETHAYLNVTFGMQADLDGDAERDDLVLTYPSQVDTVNLDVVIKDKALIRAIEGNEMVVDMGMFEGLGVQIAPRTGAWATSYTSDPPGVTLVEVQQHSPAYDNLIFQHDVPTGAPAQITLHAVINRYSDVLAEGMLKLHDGARFTYRQQIAGPSRYEVYDTHVQGVIGAGPNIKLTKQGTPIEVSTYGDTVYYVLTLTDPASNSDARWYERNDERLDPFLQSFGFGNSAATTYVGGREQKTILHSLVSPGEATRLRVELNNNTGADWSGVSVTPQPPAGLTVTAVYTDAATVPPPIFPDIPFLHQSFIPDAGRSVFYFDVQVADYAGPRGEFIEIPLAVSGSGLPADYKIPPAQLGLLDDSDQAYHVFGPAHTLALTDSLPSYVNLTGAAIAANQGQVDALTGATDDAARAAAFAALSETISYGVDGDGIATFNLPGDALNRLYVPDGGPLYVVASGSITPPSAGPNWANHGALASFTDAYGLPGYDIGDPYRVEAHGAAVRLDYACREVITGVVRSGLGLTSAADPSACVLYTDEDHLVTLQATIANVGDYRAEAVSATLLLPPGVAVLTTTPAARSVTTDTVTWQVGDLAPGGLTIVEMDVFVSLDAGGGINAAAVQPFAEVIHRTDGAFFDEYSDRTIQAKLADDFNLMVQKTERTYTAYLPTILKGFSQAPDLVVKRLQVGNSGVAVVVQNVGNAPVTEAFWVDVYLNPSQPPAYNQHWWQLAGEGLVWGVTQAIPPGGEITLTVGDAFYSTEYSSFSGVIADGTPVWAQADSVNVNNSYGGVQESDESNNVTGPVTPSAAALDVDGAGATVARQKSLPPR